MQNVDLKLEGQILTITVDLSKRFGRSSSGKTSIIATTSGNVAIPGASKGETLGLNLYTKE